MVPLAVCGPRTALTAPVVPTQSWSSPEPMQFLPPRPASATSSTRWLGTSDSWRGLLRPDTTTVGWLAAVVAARGLPAAWYAVAAWRSAWPMASRDTAVDGPAAEADAHAGATNAPHARAVNARVVCLRTSSPP